MPTYRDAGVDINAGYEAVKLMKEHVQKTFIPGTLTNIGGFGGLFELPIMNRPVLVSGTDGVGTKLKIAFLMDKHDTVGMDCVAMCANDVICCGAKPLFFLDYIAVGKLDPKKASDIVKGVAEGCMQSECSLIGGETAEMPGFYPEDEYDLAGFCVGVVDKDKIIDGSHVQEGDKIIGLPSSGIHSNGYSLVRKVFNPTPERLQQYVEELGMTLGDALLKPTRIYVKVMMDIIEKFDISAVSHITGGGFYENMPRMLQNEGLGIKINKGTWDIPPIFALLQSQGNVPEREMFNTYNMGIGMCFVVRAEKADEILRYLESTGEKAYCIGEIVKGEKEVTVC